MEIGGELLLAMSNDLGIWVGQFAGDIFRSCHACVETVFVCMEANVYSFP